MARSIERMGVSQINSQSIYAKRDMLQNYLAHSNMDVVLVSETWERTNKTFKMNGYRFLSKPRSDGYGGVAILAKTSIRLHEVDLPTFEFMEAIAARTENLDRNLLLVSLYVAPAVNATEREGALKDFKKLFEWMRGKSDLLIGGDLNAHARMWGCMRDCARGIKLVDHIQDSEMVVLNDGRPTRMANAGGTASAIDISLASIELSTEITWNVLEENLGGDHYMIEMYVKDNKVYREKRELMNEKKWVERMDEILRMNEFENANQLEDIIERVNEICVRTVDTKEIRVKGWWNNEIQYWYGKKRMALRNFNRNITSENRIILGKMTGKLKKAVRRVKRKDDT